MGQSKSWNADNPGQTENIGLFKYVSCAKGAPTTTKKKKKP